MCKFKFIADIDYGLAVSLDRTETEGTNIISMPNVTKDGRLTLADVPLIPLTEEEKEDILLKKGYLLFNWRSGSSEHVGKTVYFEAEGEYTHVSFLLRIRFDSSRNDPHYYHMLLNNLRSIGFFAAAKDRVNKTYNQTELGNMMIIVPPIEEQRQIANYLSTATSGINSLIDRIDEAIIILQEYRTALIAAAVTGKIDVRGEV